MKVCPARNVRRSQHVEKLCLLFPALSPSVVRDGAQVAAGTPCKDGMVKVTNTGAVRVLALCRALGHDGGAAGIIAASVSALQAPACVMGMYAEHDKKRLSLQDIFSGTACNWPVCGILPSNALVANPPPSKAAAAPQPPGCFFR